MVDGLLRLLSLSLSGALLTGGRRCWPGCCGGGSPGPRPIISGCRY